MKVFCTFFGLLAFCLNLNGQVKNYNDCIDPYVLCEKGFLAIDQFSGVGTIENEVSNLGCFSFDFPEFNVVWIKWKIKDPGSLSFDIIPNDSEDDIDFVLFKANNGNCSSLSELRCMVSGRNLGETYENFSNCLGSTGLTSSVSNSIGLSGCNDASNNYLSSIEVSKGEEYYLFIANYDSSNGFLFNLEGNFEIVHSNCTDENYLSGNQNLSKEVTLDIFPNPATNKLGLNVNSNQSGTGYINIYASSGRLVKSVNVEFATGVNELEIPIQQLEKGNYFIRITLDDESVVRGFQKL